MQGRTWPYALFYLTATNMNLRSTSIILITFFVFLSGCSTGDEVTVQPTMSASATPVERPTVTVAATTPPETATQTDERLYVGTGDLPWWNDAVFYEIFVRSFADSDGDGVGDINGLIERLDYLNDGNPETTDDLGVTGIWLMPIMESPSYHGYDVTDYFQIDEEYGSEEDFHKLIEAAHARGIRVIVDLVLNHTSTEHPWFVESTDPGSERRDWYVWENEDPGYRGPAGQPVWHETEEGFYYGVFWHGMPDLNLENPEVTEATHEAAEYWLQEMGVDGFRLDAIKHLVEDGRLQENTPATHEWLQEFNSTYKGSNPNAFAVGEAWTGTQQIQDYTGDEVDIAFQFELAEDIIKSSREGIGSLLTKTQSDVVEAYPPGQYATFLANHDQNRTMSQLRGDEKGAKIAASILLTSPGVPFIYYGEEIGMTGEKPDEDIRRPMQWSDEGPGAGFTEGVPWRPPAEDFVTRNVVTQDRDPESLLSHYRELIQLRNNHPALRVGDWTLVDTKPSRILSYVRQDGNETILVLINPSRNMVDDYSLSLSDGLLDDEIEVRLLFGEGKPSAPDINDAGGFTDYKPFDSLPPQSTFIIEFIS